MVRRKLAKKARVAMEDVKKIHALKIYLEIAQATMKDAINGSIDLTKDPYK